MYDDGQIIEIHKDEQGGALKRRKSTVSGQAIKNTQKMFCNYISIGIDSRIGLGFDKNRTKSRICNMFMYACEGFKKAFINTSKIKQVVKNLEQIPEDEMNSQILSNINIEI